MVNPKWLSAFGNECWYCGETLTVETATEDHMIPRARGGDDDWRNKVPACQTCNYSKQDMTDGEFIASRPVFGQRKRFPRPSLLFKERDRREHKQSVENAEKVASLAESMEMDRKPVQSASRRAEIDRQRTALSHWLQLKRRNAA